MQTLINREWIIQTIPRRPRAAHKGTFGTLLVLAGSSRFRGAAQLAVSGALRAGAGLVCLAATETVCTTVAASLPACIFQPLAANDEGAISKENFPTTWQPSPTAILAGCGLTTGPDVAEWLLPLVQSSEVPLVLDADALNILALQNNEEHSEYAAELLQTAQTPAILTPHLGEMSRLCGLPKEEIAQNRAETALQFAAQSHSVVVLKSHESLVATPAGNLYVLDGGGNPGLAKGGSGDVLAGIIASLLAQGFMPEIAAAAGVWLHAEAAAKVVALHGEAGMSPADLPLLLGDVWRGLAR